VGVILDPYEPTLKSPDNF